MRGRSRSNEGRIPTPYKVKRHRWSRGGVAGRLARQRQANNHDALPRMSFSSCWESQCRLTNSSFHFFRYGVPDMLARPSDWSDESDEAPPTPIVPTMRESCNVRQTLDELGMA